MNTSELRELLAQATPGEWKQDYISFSREEFGISADDRVIVSCNGDNGDRNATLIAAMHNAMPALLDAVEMVLKVDDVVHSSKIDVIARFYEIRAIVDCGISREGEATYEHRE